MSSENSAVSKKHIYILLYDEQKWKGVQQFFDKADMSRVPYPRYKSAIPHVNGREFATLYSGFRNRSRTGIYLGSDSSIPIMLLSSWAGMKENPAPGGAQ